MTEKELRFKVGKVKVSIWSVLFRKTEENNRYVSLLTFAWGDGTAFVHLLGVGIGFGWKD